MEHIPHLTVAEFRFGDPNSLLKQNLPPAVIVRSNNRSDGVLQKDSASRENKRKSEIL